MLRTPDQFTPLLNPLHDQAAVNLVFCDGCLMVRDSDLQPHVEMRSDALAATNAFLPVGMLAGRYFRATWLEAGSIPHPGFAFRKLRSLFGALPDDMVAIAGRAFQIVEWARTHRFCGNCGTPTLHVDGERCVRCPACGHLAYPRISPAMMVLIQRDDEILLARHLHSPSGFFTALAGFLEAGESIEEAIHREVREEVGLQVRDLSYFGSQPWPFPHSLMIAFSAQYAGGEIVIDRSEIAEAHWFGPHRPLPPIPPLGLSIAGHLIQAHLPQHRQRGSAAS